MPEFSLHIHPWSGELTKSPFLFTEMAKGSGVLSEHILAQYQSDPPRINPPTNKVHINSIPCFACTQSSMQYTVYPNLINQPLPQLTWVLVTLVTKERYFFLSHCGDATGQTLRQKFPFTINWMKSQWKSKPFNWQTSSLVRVWLNSTAALKIWISLKAAFENIQRVFMLYKKNKKKRFVGVLHCCPRHRDRLKAHLCCWCSLYTEELDQACK